jgi:hypothetical protein
LRNNKVDRILLWPQLEGIQGMFDASELVWLEKLKHILSVSRKLGLQIWFGCTVNAYQFGNQDFLERNGHELDYVHPDSKDFEKFIIDPKVRVFDKIGRPDGWFFIDRDPGKCFGTRPDSMIQLVKRSMEAFGLDKVAMWMWAGWSEEINSPKDWRMKRQDYWVEASLAFEMEFKNGEHETWVCWPGHELSYAGDRQKLMWFPYQLNEPEPSIPFIEQAIEPDDYMSWLGPGDPAGLILNLQTPCLRLPSTFKYFKNIDRKKETVVIQEIEENWVWSEESFVHLKDQLDQISFSERGTLKSWLNFSGYLGPHRRGLIVEKLYGK